MMNLFYATPLVPIHSLTSQNPLCFKPLYLTFDSHGVSLTIDLQSWSSLLQNPSVLHSVVPSSLQGLCGYTQPKTHGHSACQHLHTRETRSRLDSGRTQRKALSGRDLWPATHKECLSFGYKEDGLI